MVTFCSDKILDFDLHKSKVTCGFQGSPCPGVCVLKLLSCHRTGFSFPFFPGICWISARSRLCLGTHCMECTLPQAFFEASARCRQSPQTILTLGLWQVDEHCVSRLGRDVLLPAAGEEAQHRPPRGLRPAVHCGVQVHLLFVFVTIEIGNKNVYCRLQCLHKCCPKGCIFLDERSGFMKNRTLCEWNRFAIG